MVKHADIDHSGLSGGLVIQEADGSPIGTASVLVFPNTTLGISGGTATYTPTSSSGIVVQEDGSTEGTATVINYSTNMNVSYAGGTATVTADGGGGGGWTLGIDESGASFANFTSESGTWASDGTHVQQTQTGATHYRSHINTLVPQGAGLVMEADIRFVTGAGGDSAGGFMFGHPGSNLGAQMVVVLEPAADTIQWEVGASAAVRTVAATINTGTFYTLRVVVGFFTSVYFDGTLMGTTRTQATNTASADFLGLITYDATVDFKNIKVWTVTLPA